MKKDKINDIFYLDDNTIILNGNYADTFFNVEFWEDNNEIHFVELNEEGENIGLYAKEDEKNIMSLIYKAILRGIK